MLIKNDILNPEIMVPDIGKTHLIIRNCENMTAKFNMKNVGFPVKRMVRSNGIVKIPTNGENGLPLGRDFMFIPKKIDQLKNNGDVLPYIINFIRL